MAHVNGSEPNRVGRRAVNKAVKRAKAAKPVTAPPPPPMTPEQMAAQLFSLVFQRSHQALQIVNALLAEMPSDKGPAELYEAQALLRAEFWTAGLGIIRPAVAQLKAQPKPTELKAQAGNADAAPKGVTADAASKDPEPS